MSLTSCRHNSNHKVKISRLLIHENSCPDKLKNPLATCPFNALHKFAPRNLEAHKKVCPNKPQVDENLEKELREFLANKLLSKEITKVTESDASQVNNSNNSTSCQNKIEGKFLFNLKKTNLRL